MQAWGKPRECYAGMRSKKCNKRARNARTLNGSRRRGPSSIRMDGSHEAGLRLRRCGSSGKHGKSETEGGQIMQSQSEGRRPRRINRKQVCDRSRSGCVKEKMMIGICSNERSLHICTAEDQWVCGVLASVSDLKPRDEE